MILSFNKFDCLSNQRGNFPGDLTKISSQNSKEQLH